MYTMYLSMSAHLYSCTYIHTYTSKRILIHTCRSNEGAHSDHDLVFEYGIRALELITDETRRMPIYISTFSNQL